MINEKKLLLIGLLIGLPQAYGSDQPGMDGMSQLEPTEEANQREKEKAAVAIMEEKRPIVEEEQIAREEESLAVVRNLQSKERELRKSIIELEILKEFLKKKQAGLLTEEYYLEEKKDFPDYTKIIFHSVLAVSRLRGIEQQLVAEKKKKSALMNASKEKEREINLLNKQGSRLEGEKEQLKKKIKDLSGFQTPLVQAENQYKFVKASLTSLDSEDEDFDENRQALKEYLLNLGYLEADTFVVRVLKKNSEEAEGNKRITLEERIKLFEELDQEATKIRTSLSFHNFAKKLTTLLQSKQFAPVAVPTFDEISGDRNVTSQWEESTQKLIDFIIADWEFIRNKIINLNIADDLLVVFGMNAEEFGEIEGSLIYPLKNISLEKFSAYIHSPDKEEKLLRLLAKMVDYFDYLKKQLQEREKEINDLLYSKNENSKFTQDYNKKASIKTMHDYLNTVLVSCQKYVNMIDFIFLKIGRRATAIEQVKPIREVGELLSVFGVGVIGLSMKKSAVPLSTHLKDKQFKLAVKDIIGASLNKFGLVLPVGIGVALYGHYKTDTLGGKKAKFEGVIRRLKSPYDPLPEAA